MVRTTRTSGGLGSGGSEYGPDSFAQADSFARAVDAGMRRAADPALNRELTLVASLRQAGSAIGPSAVERDRMRQRIMAEFPSVVHEGSSPVLPLRPPARRRAIPEETRGRLVVAVAAALCLLMSLSGMSLLLSRDALPGDALYAFKRSAESAELGLTFGDQRKALKHLEFADARVNEIEALANEADSAGTWSAEQDRFLQVLDDFEQDTTAGTRLLTTVAANGQPGILSPLRGWVQQQETRLRAVQGALPLPASARLDSTLELLDRVTARVAALDQRSSCRTVASGAHDDLGALPARGVCESVTPGSGSSTTPLAEGGLTPDTSPVNSLVPPGLLTSPSGTPDPVPGRTGQLKLPTDAGGVLPAPGKLGSKPAHPVPGNGSTPSVLPLPLPSGIPLLPFLQLEKPHVE